MTLSHYSRFDPWPGTMRCVLGQSTLLTQIVYPHRCINKKLKSWKKPCDGLASHLPHVTEIGISSRPAWWLTGSCANFYIHTWPSKTNPSDWTRNCQEWATVLDGFLSNPFFYNNLQTRVGSLFSHFEVSFVCSQHISGFSKCRLSITTVRLMSMVFRKITKIALDLTVWTTPPAPYSLSLPLSPVSHVVLSDTTRLIRDFKI